MPLLPFNERETPNQLWSHERPTRQRKLLARVLQDHARTQAEATVRSKHHTKPSEIGVRQNNGRCQVLAARYGEPSDTFR